MCEMVGQFIQKKQEEKQIEEDQAANARYWKIPAYYDDDDDYNFAIITNEPVNSLSMGDEYLDTIPTTESKSLFDEDFLKEIYSNPLFDEEIISMKIDPHHFNAESDLIESLLNHDSSIISSSSKIDSILFSMSSPRLLYDNSSPCPPKEFVSENSNADVESFSPSPIPVKDSDSFMKEIDLSFTLDDPMLPGIEEDDYDSERDILILEELLDNHSLSLPENESFHFDTPSSSRPPAKPPDGNTRILNIKMMGDISEQKVLMPRLMITLVSNQEKSPDLLSHQGLEIFQPSAECLMMIHGKNTHILDVP
nr:hypothetical protein [Tanacetum cinerariifolium]